MAALHFSYVCVVFYVQMQRDCQAQVKWSYWERRSMHRWRLIVNRDTLTSRAGTVHCFFFFFSSIPQYIATLSVEEKKHYRVGYNWLPCLYISLGFQVCQAPPPAASAALHWPKVLGAPVLLQADWRHPNRHLLNGNAWSAASAHLTWTSLDPVQSGLHQGIAVPPALDSGALLCFTSHLTPSPHNSLLHLLPTAPSNQYSPEKKTLKLSEKKKKTSM